ncbi:GIY-YIG nuclease family protein [Paracoccus alcaliphilus]|nr:GIY-YIG nuclease family protein [Paracoccus alcaliphilus]
MPIPGAWHDLARQKGMTIVARVQDRYHLALACDACGKPSRHKISALRVCQPQCPHCLESQWQADAERAGLTFLRRDPDDNMYSWYRAPCGHELRRQPDRMRQIAAGKNGSRCEICHAAREAAEAETCGWSLLGPDPEGDVSYRLYQHGCGHQQRIARANMQTNRFACTNCGTCWSAAPSWLYLLRMTFPDFGPVVKCGYSRDPASRMHFQLGMSTDLGSKLVTQIPMATGHDAIRTEKRLHRKLRRTHPDSVLPPEIIARHLNVVSEVYDAALEPIILAELTRIAASTQT